MDRAAQKAIAEHLTAVGETLAVLAAYFDPAVTMLATCLTEGGKILLCGNGGSATDCMHLAAELVVRYKNDRLAYPAIALTADAAILTACANDYGYEKVFARQVEAYGRAGDVLVAYSTSGKSRNVLEAIAVAKHRGLSTLGLSGKTPLGCDIDLAVPSTTTARIQEMHHLCGHLLIESLEARLPP